MPESRRKIAARRGYMAIQVRDRGNTPRGMKRAFNAASKESWHGTAIYFHENLREERFTPEHALKAGYVKRRGQNMSPTDKGYYRQYYGRKLRNPRQGGGPGKANPLWKTGKTRQAVRFARISSTSKGGKAAYSGANVFNYRNPKSQVRMNEEFRRIIPDEAIKLASVYDASLDDHLKTQDEG